MKLLIWMQHETAICSHSIPLLYNKLIHSTVQRRTVQLHLPKCSFSWLSSVTWALSWVNATSWVLIFKRQLEYNRNTRVQQVNSTQPTHCTCYQQSQQGRRRGYSTLGCWRTWCTVLKNVGPSGQHDILILFVIGKAVWVPYFVLAHNLFICKTEYEEICHPADIAHMLVAVAEFL